MTVPVTSSDTLAAAAPPPGYDSSMADGCADDSDGSEDGSTPRAPAAIIYLTPVQSCNLHGWMNPKRTLTWRDVKKSPNITLGRCLQSGLTAKQLRGIQPDVKMWVRHKKVSFCDVPVMKEWPLHPVLHLRGNISDLAGMHYAPSVMRAIGITYEYMRDCLKMDDNWMRMMRYSPSEWVHMGFTQQHAASMGRKRVDDVFKMDYDTLLLAMAAAAETQ
jgi:hypothetical protein